MTFESEELLNLLLYGFWAPIFFIGMLYFIFKFYLNLRLQYRERYMEKKRYARDDEATYRLRSLEEKLENVIDRFGSQASFGEKYFESAFERITEILSKEMRGNLRSVTRNLSRQLAVDLKGELKDTKNQFAHLGKQDLVIRENRTNIIREISHALYTPLSRVEAIASNVNSMNPSPAIVEKMGKAKSAVEICYAYLAAYRGLINISSQTTYWNPDSLKDSLASSSEVYIDASGKSLEFNIDSPETVGGISNIYLIATLLPLIENAVDACNDRDKFSVSITSSSDGLSAEVSNPVHGEFPGDKVFQPGFSTKPRSEGAKAQSETDHEGLGLTIVKNLLSTVAGSQVSYRLDGNIVTFSLRIPSSQG